jgi:hypothetical protein
LNNASLGAATFIYVANTDAAGASEIAFLDGLDDSTNSTDRGEIHLQQIEAPPFCKRVLTATALFA